MQHCPQKKGIGIIGYGAFGEFLRSSWNAMDCAEVVAVCDSDTARAPGDIDFFTDPAAMFEHPDLDIVSIATPPNSHKELAVMAMEAGKHVLVEKPLALCEADAVEIKRTAQRTARAATVNFVLRYNPLTDILRDLVTEGVLGVPRRVDLRNYATRDQLAESHWFWDPRVSGRIFLEHGVHFFDLSASVLGARAKEVFAMGIEVKPGIEDRVFAAVRYDNDVAGTFWHSFSRPRELERTTLHIALDLGEIEVTGWIPEQLRLWGWTDGAGAVKIESLPMLKHMNKRPLGAQTRQSSGIDYNVEFEFEALVSIGRPKLEVYAESLRAVMQDLISASEDADHKLRVTLDDGIEAVRTAELATRFVHPEG